MSIKPTAPAANPTVARWQEENRKTDIKHHLGAAGWAFVRAVTPDKTLLGAPIATRFQERATAKDLAANVATGLKQDLFIDPVQETKTGFKELGNAWRSFQGGPRVW